VSLDRVPDDYWTSIGLLTGAYEVQGAAAAQRGDFDQAIAIFLTAYDIAAWPTTATWLARAYAGKGDPATAIRYFAHASRSESRKPEVPKELRDYVGKEFGGSDSALQSKLSELGKERLFLDRIVPENGAFVVPSTDPGSQGVTILVRVLVDENGKVEDARTESEAAAFRSAALADVRRIRFKPLGTPEAPIKSLRVVEFFYLPATEVRAFWRFAEPPGAKSVLLRKVRSSLTSTSSGP
jgi:hypothetical protein